jgi:hypothetical protein
MRPGVYAVPLRPAMVFVNTGAVMRNGAGTTGLQVNLRRCMYNTN